MKRITPLWAFIIGAVLGFLIFAFTPIGNRYYFQQWTKAMGVYRYDKWTGKAWLCSSRFDSGCVEQTAPKKR